MWHEHHAPGRDVDASAAGLIVEEVIREPGVDNGFFVLELECLRLSFDGAEEYELHEPGQDREPELHERDDRGYGEGGLDCRARIVDCHESEEDGEHGGGDAGRPEDERLAEEKECTSKPESD